MIYNTEIKSINKTPVNIRWVFWEEEVNEETWAIKRITTLYIDFNDNYNALKAYVEWKNQTIDNSVIFNEKDLLLLKSKQFKFENVFEVKNVDFIDWVWLKFIKIEINNDAVFNV